MIFSMTGFGRFEQETDDIKIAVEMRALNSKNLELNLRLPQSFRVLEQDLRKQVGQALLRGKVDLSIQLENLQASSTAVLNKDIIQAYIDQLQEIAEATPGQHLQMALRLPDALLPQQHSVSEKDQQTLIEAVEKATEQLTNHRSQEGAAMKTDLMNQLTTIEKGAQSVDLLKESRVEKVKSRLQEALNQLAAETDENRYAQELVYYLEKLDLNEELVRLRQHLTFFREILNNNAPTKGKKLGFVAQEIGREVNTIGSKANHVEIQKQVVEMKDALERIKEQLLNVL